MTPDSLPNPVVMVILLGALSLAPFILVMLTSFVKISVVLSILRNALGTQNVPPNQVITGLAFVLTLFIMTPVVTQMYHAAGPIANAKDMFSEASVRSVIDAISRGREPLRQFLIRHAHNEDRVLFVDLADRLAESTEITDAARGSGPAQPSAVSSASVLAQTAAPGQPGKDVSSAAPAAGAASAQDAPARSQNPTVSNGSRSALSMDDFQVIIPAFVTSQLKEAFEIGFLIFIPFVIIDMVIANILLAMGMSMLSPSVISLPFKLLLFVLVDGWFLLIRGLVLSYL